MIIRHFLAKGHNDIPISDITYATEHVEYNGEIRHVGFKVCGNYAGDNERNKKHKYELIFETEKEYLELLERAANLAHRFPEGKLPPIIGEADEAVDEADEDD